MKKIIITILITLSIILIPNVKASEIELPEKTDHEIVKVYLFWSSKCQYCHNLIEYFSDKYIDYTDYFEIVTYQTNNSTDNSNLFKEVISYYPSTISGTSIPVIIIGDTYQQQGFGSDGTNIIKEALKAYEDENYIDMVEVAKENINSTAESKTFIETCSTAGVTCKTSSSTLSDTMVLGIIFGILIIGFGGLIIYSRKK